MNSLWTVVGFTIKNKIKGKAFLITTLIIAIVLSIGANVPYIITQFDKGEKITNVGYIQVAGGELAAGAVTGDSLKAYFEGQEKSTIKMIPFKDQGSVEANETQLKDAIEAKDIKGYLDFEKQSDSVFPKMTYKSEKLMEFSITGNLQFALEKIRQDDVLKNVGLTPEQQNLLNAPIKIETVQISSASGGGEAGGKTPEEQGVNMGLIYVILFFLFMAIMISGQLIASEITAEKSSRVMEILITSVSPLKSMFGKIFGMFVVVLCQVAVYAIVIFINASLPHNKETLKTFDIDLSLIDPALLIYAVLFFLTGFFLFATLYAAVGSIVSRTEDLGQATMPMTIISLAGFYIAIFSLSNPDSMLVKVSSFIPLFSPFVMMLRLGLTDVPLWEVLLSFGLLLAMIYIAVYTSAKIYRTGVLMYGKRPSWKEIRKAMKAYKI
ncbi:ABC transporter permease [Paenibacillus sp. GSMTC-2017]|uniref:ABC transporter permease n=1 Tax=Paenibacillus sp. GSMTC-2017 TaxID=2794350 RepID=UPI0018D8418C|nr:ABC transporter permease [Paenibacillus sp. GSMTC-2017]MBH5320203.1 ABC transporter permease [Paenibacillus sp. GSMTC-2017]